jgi:hypothetical protein
MRYLLVFVLIITGLTLSAQQYYGVSHSKRKDFTNKEQVISIGQHPISFYLNHAKIDPFSKRFYRGELSISTDSISASILDSVLTNNAETRPFYFFIFSQIVNMSEDNMIDVVGHKEVQFIDKYPCEFFRAFNQSDIDINVVKWTTFMGRALENKSNYYEFRNRVDSKLKAKCSDLQDVFKSFFTEVRMCLVR